MPEDLYALPPEEFTAARDAAAKQARVDGDKAAAVAIKALRRPTVPAHLVNLLVRAEPDLVDQLIELGQALGQAQAEGSGGAMRELGEQRRALVGAVTSRAVELGARAITAAIRAEVESTLEAAMADSGSAAAVRTGRLVRALSYAGFGGVDLDGAVADAVTAPDPRTAGADRDNGSGAAEDAGDRGAERDADRDAAERAAAAAERRRAELAAAERAAQEAAGALDDAVDACRVATQAQDRAAAGAKEAAEQVARLEEELAAARATHEQAAEAEQAADREVDVAGERVRAAQEEAERTRTALDRLRRT